MFTYTLSELNRKLEDILSHNIPLETLGWLKEKALIIQSEKTSVTLNSTFAGMPRKTGKKIVMLSRDNEIAVQHIRPDLTIRGWSVDRLCRVWLLMQIEPLNKTDYQRKIEKLFRGAEMNELVALYSSLPVLAFPEIWKMQCAEGIRSNIADVLEAIMCNNPYPAENLEEAEWNQLVLKAFFTEKPIHAIIGLDKRANPTLARILSDYAHERWAAHRPVHPMLWRCVAPFINADLFRDIERIAYSENTMEREAAVLACSLTQYFPAKEFLQRNAHLRSIAEDKSLSWETIAQKAQQLS